MAYFINSFSYKISLYSFRGNRKGKLRTYLNVLIVFVVSGFWHGPSMNYIIWGFMNGTAMVFHRMFKEKIEKLPKVLMWTATFVFVNVCWIMFRASSLGEFIQIINNLVHIEAGSINSHILACFNLVSIHTIFDGIFQNSYLFYVYCMVVAVVLISKNLNQVSFKAGILVLLFALFVFILSLCSLSNISTYIYQWF